MKILYITYIDFNAPQTSGSSVRPVKMQKAFLEIGEEVILLSGSMSIKKRKARLKNIKQIRNWIKTINIDYCYIESSTYPIMFHADRALIRHLCRKRIPTAYFYRDMYRRFPQLFPRRSGLLNWFKEKYLNILQWRTDCLLRSVDIVYFPSELAAAQFNYRDMRSLPPAGECRFSFEQELNNILIYVGGISERYGFNVLIDAFKILNSENNSFTLLLVCREEEWMKVQCQHQGLDWLIVEHVSGKELETVYAAASAAVITKEPNEYNDMAVSVKFFEYMSFGLPIISTTSESTDKIIKHYNIGVTVSYEATELAKAIKMVMSDPVIYNEFRANVRKALLAENLWIHRAQQVRDDLLSLPRI